MFYFLDSEPTFLSFKHSHTFVAPIYLDRAYPIALEALIVVDSELFIGKIILSFGLTSLLVVLFELISL